MQINVTRAQLWDMFSSWSTNEVIDYLEGHGMELVGLELPAHGVYRREDGTDLVRLDEWDTWIKLDASGEGINRIDWTLFGDTEWWIRVLDEDNRPVWDGPRIRMNEKGERVE